MFFVRYNEEMYEYNIYIKCWFTIEVKNITINFFNISGEQVMKDIFFHHFYTCKLFCIFRLN